eukprot:1646602-Pleurochrysis_carterae.AAC.1
MLKRGAEHAEPDEQHAAVERLALGARLAEETRDKYDVPELRKEERLLEAGEQRQAAQRVVRQRVRSRKQGGAAVRRVFAREHEANEGLASGDEKTDQPKSANGPVEKEDARVAQYEGGQVRARALAHRGLEHAEELPVDGREAVVARLGETLLRRVREQVLHNPRRGAVALRPEPAQPRGRVTQRRLQWERAAAADAGAGEQHQPAEKGEEAAEEAEPGRGDRQERLPHAARDRAHERGHRPHILHKVGLRPLVGNVADDGGDKQAEHQREGHACTREVLERVEREEGKRRRCFGQHGRLCAEGHQR